MFYCRNYYSEYLDDASYEVSKGWHYIHQEFMELILGDKMIIWGAQY
jgi:hypothetical protein